MPTLIDKRSDLGAQDLCRRHGSRSDLLIEILHEVQDARGFVSEEAISTIAAELNLSRAEVVGVVSFYHDFRRTRPTAPTLQICRAEACQAVGSEDLFRWASEQLPPDVIAVHQVFCLGNCALGPSAMHSGELLGRVTRERLIALTDELRARGHNA